MKTNPRDAYPSSLRARITILFVISAVFIEGVFAAFWIYHLAPRLEAEMQSDINALAQAHAVGLATALSEKEIRRDAIVNIIDSLLLLEEPATKTPLVLGVELIIDYDVLRVKEGDLDLSRWQSAMPRPRDQDLLSVDIPLFSRTTRELVGIARFHSSKAFFNQLKNDVLKTFLMATGVLMAMLFACWLFLIALLRPLHRLADALGSKSVGDVVLLPELKGWISKEIGLVKTALDELLGRIHAHTQGLTSLNMILSTQQETSLDGILVVDETGRMVSFNRRFVDMWQIPEDIVATKSDERALQSVMDKLAAPEEFMAQVKYLYGHPNEKSREEISLIDGRTLERYSSPMIGEDGKNFGRIWYFHDITEYKQAEEKIRRLDSEKLALLAQVTAMVSHELRNPLGVIRTSNYYLQRHIQGANPKIEKHFNRIDEQISLCNAIIEELLEYTLSREIFVSRQALVPWLEQVAKEFGEAQGIAIDFQLPQDLGAVYHDKEKLRKAMVSLLTNAAQAVKDKTGDKEARGDGYRPEIGIHAHLDQQLVVIEVIDNGVGMSEATHQRAFEPLFTTRARGIGLGLANVKRIVDEHGGSIDLQSCPGKGTTITLRIPNRPRHP
ncbi:MAG: PAS-domain containing protein [Desulfobacterales bacterium]|nr:PAS-domain containing protein [Desulfobacterales bacterium]